jgi:hypothetical protein
LHYLPGIVRLLATLDRIGEAEDLIPDESVARNGRHRNCLLTCRALMAEGRGERERAAELYRQAASAWLSYGALFELGQAHLGAARCLLDADAALAAEHLREARERFASLDAVGLVADVDALLREDRAATS